MAPATFRFGEHQLDMDRLELRRAGSLVPLQPKAMDLLIHLVRHRDRVVSKDELLSTLWPDVVVTEASLSKAVAAARRALGDEGDDPSWIETVRGRGFRFATDPDHEAPAREPVPVEAAPGDPFVGRQDVRAAVEAALAGAREGEGRLLLLAGEAGMGKTRTVQEVTAWGERAGLRALSGWCHEAEDAPDLWPWLVVSRQLLEGTDVDALVGGLGQGVAELAELVPALREHLPARPGSAALDPSGVRFRRLETLAELLARAARRAPLLVLLDDFHRADPDSLALLRFVAPALGSTPLVLLVAHRPESLGADHPLVALSRAPRCEPLRLTGLSRADVAELARAITGKEVPRPVAEAIHEQSDGNPFFVRELARGFDAAGGAGDPGRPPLPAGVRSVLQERVEGLSAPCRGLMAMAALLGRDLDVTLLAHAGGHTTERTLELLDEAYARHVLRREAGAFRFAHALLREELLASLGAASRARLHRTLAETLESHYRDDLDPHIGRLAHHYCAGAAAGCAAEAVRYAGLAGDRARRLHAHREAADHYRRALDALPLLPVAEDARRAELLLALGESAMASGEIREGRETLERAADAARRAGSYEIFARAALAAGGLELSSPVGSEDPGLVALLEEALSRLPDGGSALGIRLRTRLGEALYWAHAWERSGEAIERAVADGRRLGDPVALAFALYGRHWREFVGPAPGAQLEDADELIDLAQRVGQQDLLLAGHSCRFLVLLQRGRGGEALLELARYETLARELRVPRYRWRGHCYRAALASLEGRFDDVEAAAADARSEEQLFHPRDAVGTMVLFFLRREQKGPPEADVGDAAARLPALSATWRAAVALLLADAGRLDEAAEALASLVRRDFVAVPRSFNRLTELVLATEACALVGDAELAARLRDLLEPYRPRMVVIAGGFFCLGSIDLFLGRAAATAGDDLRAREHLEAALEFNAKSGARPWLAWSQLELARVLLRLGGARAPERADRLRADALDTARALGMARLVEAAEGLAGEPAS